MKFVLASHNAKKVAEMQHILQELGVEIVRQSDVGLDLEPEENGTTFAENSLIKAKAICEASGLPAIADDSGLCVDALEGGPGVYSARYGGESCKTDADRTNLLLKNLENVPDDQRGAHFATVITCVLPSGETIVAEGACYGVIAHAPSGEGGFGYDPVFLVPALGKTFAELTAEEKNAISHRGNALRDFKVKLEGYFNA